MPCSFVLRVAFALTLIAAAVVPVRAGKRADCKRTCADRIAACQAANDDVSTLKKACPGAVVRECVKAGVAFCQVTTTTTLPGLRIAKTGQAICYDATGSVIGCAGTGQDGELQQGVARTYSDAGNGTITDNLTGLTWEKLSDDGSVHDKDTLYTWATAFTDKVAPLNTQHFAGFDDWRLPNTFELFSLANHGATNPATFPIFNLDCTASCTVLNCSCTDPGAGYWTSTSFALNPAGAFFVTFGDGGLIGGFKSSLSHVRAVRGGN